MMAEERRFDDFSQTAFDASRYANAIIQAGTIAATLDQISEGIHVLELDIRAQVAIVLCVAAVVS